MRSSLTSQVRGQYEIIDRALTVRSARSGLIANGLIACSQSRDSASDEVADTIFLSGPILTMDGASPPYVEAEAVIDGVIVYAGDNDGAKADATWWASQDSTSALIFSTSGMKGTTATAGPKAS